MDTDPLWIQFAKAPQAGRVKTRLQALLGEEGALALHCELVRLTNARLLAAAPGAVELAVTAEPGHSLFQACRDAGCRDVQLQLGDDLGARMFNALQRGLVDRRRVLLVGSDCPDLDAAYCAAAAAALDWHDLVLGPAEDGGYVLIGARRVDAVLFRGIEWGSASVLEETLARARRAGLSTALLQMRRDIDEPADYHWWLRRGRGDPGRDAR